MYTLYESLIQRDFLSLQVEMDRDHREQHDHDNINENEEEQKVGMDFRNLSRHHGVDHVADVEIEVLIIPL